MGNKIGLEKAEGELGWRLYSDRANLSPSEFIGVVILLKILPKNLFLIAKQEPSAVSAAKLLHKRWRGQASLPPSDPYLTLPEAHVLRRHCGFGRSSPSFLSLFLLLTL